MSRSISIAAIALALASAGCATTSTYRVFPISAEAAADKLDGQWFERDIYNKDGQVLYIELVYCPVLPKEATTCRSAIVWQRNNSRLLAD